MKACYKKYVLDFKLPAGTSRGVLAHKETWLLMLREGGRYGIGECGLFRGLSADDVVHYEEQLKWVCAHIQLGKEALWEALRPFPSIQFGVEQAFLSLASKNPFLLFPSDFTEKQRPIPINGLIWMGDEVVMCEQIEQKLALGFNCIKMKIGATDFKKEVAILETIRKRYTKEEITVRVDANGAFTPREALQKLTLLSEFDLHSIEQPIKQGNPKEMKRLCAISPVPIALDEELIGIFDANEKEELLHTIRPQFIILKPSLIGGYKGSAEWITLAEKQDIGWWITSALESNIGLNAIAQWTFTLKNQLPQGLGTGSLFTNNFASPLTVEQGNLVYKKNKNWETTIIDTLCT
ncbi:MAG: o-succinylbenzoate synthase [Maribacter sp.]|nr:o-succinylbenzoate synthase [Maribacter sp.]